MLRRLLALLLLTSPLAAQRHLTTPREALGFGIGDDYQLATYTQLEHWWEQLATESPRMVLDTMGLTAEGRPQLMAILSSPANIARLARYREISETLARGRVDSAMAARLAAEGKAVIWIDGGLHATEVLGATQLMELVWQFVSRDDPETQRILDDVIILAVHANPDGMELVSSWYMRHDTPEDRTTSGLPRLYQKYVGHDNNRDMFRNAQAESRNMSRVMFTEWYPQIMYNHHQTGPAGAVMFAPPFRDPLNFNFDPDLITSLDWVAMAMQRRFAYEGKPGVVSQNASSYSTWWNGGVRTTAYFHNMIGILTETIGSPTPTTIPLRLSSLVPNRSQPFPITAGPWHFRQSVDYSMTANRAILDLASRYREDLLMNIWRMGHNSVERGSADHWTYTPDLVAEAQAAMTAGQDQAANAAPSGGFRRGGGGGGDPEKAMAVLRDPGRRDPRGYVIPAGQAEMGNALDFLDAMRVSGIEIAKTTAPTEIAGKRYPVGSFIVRGDQAFRPHVLDMFEPQDHPTDLQYPGGPPVPPYDIAGWTLAMQMGFRYDRMLDDFTAPTAAVEGLRVTPDPAPFDDQAGAWVVSPTATDAFLAVNRAIKAGGSVDRLDNGDFVLRGAGSREALARLARERALPTRSAGGASGTAVHPLRVGLVDVYGGSMSAGWTRWVLEQYEQPFTRVFPARLDRGDLASDFDVLIFVDGMIPSADRGGRGFGGGDPTDLPDEYRDQVGRITVATTVPQLRAFVESGGRIVTIGSSTVLARHFGLPLENHLVQRLPDGADQPLSRDQYYVPGSLLAVRVDNRLPAAAGADTTATVMFENSPVFRLPPDATSRGITPIAWFDSATPLRSGWAHGEGYLQDGVAMARADIGKGQLYLYGPEVMFRGQPEGTYRFVFNVLLGEKR